MIGEVMLLALLPASFGMQHIHFTNCLPCSPFEQDLVTEIKVPLFLCQISTKP